MKMPYAAALFTKAAASLGWKPFPTPVATPSRNYRNQYGAELNACIYCGYCEGFACEVAAKASPQTAVMPVLMKNKNFELRTLANVTRVNLDPAKKRAVSVTYVDSRGREFEQPAELVLLTSYVFNNVRLMLLSGIGKPYDPVASAGVVGRNYAYQTPSSVTLFFEDKHFNSFMGAGGLGMAVEQWKNDDLDPTRPGFLRGGVIRLGSHWSPAG